MAKHIVFQPVDLESDDNIKETVLWGASFQIHPEIEPTLPKEMLDLVNNKSSISYPLAYRNNEFSKLGFELDIDFLVWQDFFFLF